MSSGCRLRKGAFAHQRYGRGCIKESAVFIPIYFAAYRSELLHHQMHVSNKELILWNVRTHKNVHYGPVVVVDFGLL